MISSPARAAGDGDHVTFHDEMVLDSDASSDLPGRTLNPGQGETAECTSHTPGDHLSPDFR
ncbi:MAG: hypothetical protein LJE75_02155 [Gammaproteobacteria bacterium]|jgi:hypothetical protein|nr:hypothetical protein [Gammaproteobacteria bacterium]